MATLFAGADTMSLVPMHLRRLQEVGIDLAAAEEEQRKVIDQIDAARIRRVVQRETNRLHDRFMVEPNMVNRSKLIDAMDAHHWLATQPDAVVLKLGFPPTDPEQPVNVGEMIATILNVMALR